MNHTGGDCNSISLRSMIIIDGWAKENVWKKKKKKTEQSNSSTYAEASSAPWSSAKWEHTGILWLMMSSFGFQNLVSRVSGGTRTDQLLNLTRSTLFRFSKASQQREQNKSGHYRVAPNLNTTTSTVNHWLVCLGEEVEVGSGQLNLVKNKSWARDFLF